MLSDWLALLMGLVRVLAFPGFGLLRRGKRARKGDSCWNGIIS